MRAFIFAFAFLLTSTSFHAESVNRTCKQVIGLPPCTTIHARLMEYQGFPSFRLWQVGTHHVFGVFSNFQAMQITEGLKPDTASNYANDAEAPDMPEAAIRALIGRRENSLNPENMVFADFDICPLERFQRGAMQGACIKSAHRIHAKKIE